MADRHRTLSLLALGTAVLLTACESSPTAPRQPVTVTRLAFSSISGFDDPQRLVVRSGAEWQGVWATLHRRTNPVPPLPAIDFDREMVVVAAAGTKSTGGFAVSIDSASETRSTIAVVVRSVSPGPNCVVIQMVTQPVDVAVISRRPAVVSFEEKAEVVSCS